VTKLYYITGCDKAFADLETAKEYLKLRYMLETWTDGIPGCRLIEIKVDALTIKEIKARYKKEKEKQRA